ncbi:putative oxidoreductase Fe-S binding subunit [Salmonella enterica subsp. enterica serovar Anatum str. USDA 100]|nr:putative oxidoreductase Fe-S binding subunit [Salmonella enterica subsp. enterica serovar Anatum str. USDA 100]
MQMVLTPVAPNQFKASAHKCDLCQGREQGPACVENCPADALQLVTEDSLTRLAKTRRLRTARQEIRPWHTVDYTTQLGQQAAKFRAFILQAYAAASVVTGIFKLFGRFFLKSSFF